MEDAILTIDEVAAYLRVSDRTVYEWAQHGEIPAGKIGTVWRFKKSEIERWVNMRLAPPVYEADDMTVQIKNILAPGRVIFISQTSKRDAIVELAEALSVAPQVKDSGELISKIWKREELMSTAIGRGIAIPHVRIASVTDLVMAVGICKTPLADFTAIDDVPVNLLFMIAAAYNQHSYYLKTLSHLSIKLKKKELRDSLVAAETTQFAYELLITA